MRKVVMLWLAGIMLFALLPSGLLAGTVLEEAVIITADYMAEAVKNPQVNSVGGDWAVIGLARGGMELEDSYFENYYQNVAAYVKERGGILHKQKYTEYSRVILALTAAGYDARDVGGYDLTAPLEDFEKTVWQGINGSVWALIALDSLPYPNSRRDAYINEILNKQLKSGGWSLSGGGSGEADITGMVLQALAKYQDNDSVKKATDKALSFLSQAQDSSGGYTSWGKGNVESTSQVLVALCELGISFEDTRFVKNGVTLIDNILSFQNKDGSFKHTESGDGNTQMSTEQAFYALVAAVRAEKGKNSLYRMGDAPKRNITAQTELGLPGKHEDVELLPVIYIGKTFDDIQNHANQAAIEALAARGIISGKSNGLFEPDAHITRAEFAAIIIRSLGLPEKTKTPFADTPKSAWYTNAVATAYYYGIVTGTTEYEEKLYSPNAEITLQEAAVMITRAAKLCGIETARSETQSRNILAQFADYRTAATWSQAALAFCYDTGILDDSELNIEPLKKVKRCLIAEMTYRMLDKARLCYDNK